jgi:hypothetical protein
MVNSCEYISEQAHALARKIMLYLKTPACYKKFFGIT